MANVLYTMKDWKLEDIDRKSFVAPTDAILFFGQTWKGASQLSNDCTLPYGLASDLLYKTLFSSKQRTGVSTLDRALGKVVHLAVKEAWPNYIEHAMREDWMKTQDWLSEEFHDRRNLYFKIAMLDVLNSEKVRSLFPEKG